MKEKAATQLPWESSAFASDQSSRDGHDTMKSTQTWQHKDKDSQCMHNMWHILDIRKSPTKRVPRAEKKSCKFACRIAEIKSRLTATSTTNAIDMQLTRAALASDSGHVLWDPV